METAFIVEYHPKYSCYSRYFRLNDSSIDYFKSMESLDVTKYHLIGLLFMGELEGFNLRKLIWGQDGNMIQVNFDDFVNLAEDIAGFGDTTSKALDDFIKNLNKEFYQS